MRYRFFFALAALVFSSQLHAHPLTDTRFDRTAAVRLSPEGIEVTYTLEVSSIAMHLDAAKRMTPADIAALDRTPVGYATAYAKKVALELTDKFNISLDGQPLPLRVTAIDVKMTDHAVCRFTLKSEWPPGNRERTLSIRDNTFQDLPGVLNLTLDLKGSAGNQVELSDLDEPPAKVRTQPLAKLTPEEAAMARNASARVRLPAAVASPSHSPEGTPEAKGKATEPTPEPVVSAEVSRAPDLVTDLVQRGLPALFDWKLGIGLLLLAAFLFGAAHAFTPGHGKTLVAAYLIGERGTVRHAILLAFTTTITHTGSVIAVAAILWSVYGNEVPGRTQGGLQFVAGLLVTGVGAWLLLRRATGQADHFHFFGGHHHHHSHGGGHGHSHSHSDGHSHSHDQAHSHSHDQAHSHSHNHTHSHSHDHAHAAPNSAKKSVGWLRIVLMGMGGGIVPCWDAVLLLVAAAAMNRVGFAVPLLLAFSAGLGAVLVGLGISVVYAYRMGAHRFREQRWFQLLPMVSAVFLVGVGIWLCKQGIQMTMQ
jgi:nickel/cobalt exporter